MTTPLNTVPAPAVSHAAASAEPAAPRPLSAAAAAARDEGFRSAMGEVRAAPNAAAPLTLGVERRGSQNENLSPAQKFESFVLRSLVEEMLPKDNEEFYGKGMAGNVWRSMMAERMGEEIARGGGVGIADIIAEKTPDAAKVDNARTVLTGSPDAAALKLPTLR
ncbi:rod-binding protein [Aurantimonas sp. Leaf443]|uniref:rod-binding protein n=1 Tax=Aurantimonas sp. Leaf443 TaxID=1736378 RepID=UPI0006FFDB9C|nr:rod-binding protein [Aurantimonas sp. Leaf443]KQT82455.1 hypothetical protein ASG48_15385 [Aurantimonas sp. Leaf443]